MRFWKAFQVVLLLWAGARGLAQARALDKQPATVSARPKEQIWIAGITPFMRRARHLSDPSDYMELFQPDSPWPVSSDALTALKIPDQMASGGTDEELRTIIQGLKRRHIGLAIEMGLIHGPFGGCGKGIEGFGTELGPRKTAERIRKLGGVVAYIAMDEPVVFGHRPLNRNGSGGCQYSIATLADQVALRIAELQQVFPDIQVGDIEPIGGGPDGVIVNRDILDFVAQLKQRTHGAAPAFLHADIQWNSAGWRPNLEQLGLQLHARHIPVGVICDGGGPGIKDSIAWIDNAVKRCGVIANDRSIAADHYVVQSWEPLPTKMLPETSPGTMTNEVKRVLEMLRGATNRVPASHRQGPPGPPPVPCCKQPEK